MLSFCHNLRSFHVEKYLTINNGIILVCGDKITNMMKTLEPL